MKDPRLMLCLLSVLLTSPAAGQITLDGAFFESLIGRPVQTRVYLMDSADLASLTPLINATGPNQSYDFRPFTYGFPTITAYDVLASAEGTPGQGDPVFAESDWVQRIGTNTYVYYDLSSDGFFLLGSIFVQGANQTVMKNVPPDPTYRFPLTDGSAWSEEFVSTTESFGTTSQTTSTVDFLVLGWGTLVTPAGSAPALLLRKTLTTELAEVQLFSTTSYIFVTEQLMGASIILNEQGDVLSASYNDSGSGTTSVEETPQQAFRLAQNYPNPFSGTTQISFELERPAHVVVSVFDVMGREVGRVVDSRLSAGSHNVEFGADGLSSGIYLYRLEIDGSRLHRQLTVQR